MTMPPVLDEESLLGTLMIGRKGRLIGQFDFAIPVAGSRGQNPSAGEGQA